MRIALKLLLLLSLLATAASASALGSRQRAKLQETQDAYAEAVRWGDFESAVRFVEPAYAEQNPVGEFELGRYEQIQVSGYRELNTNVEPDGTVVRSIEVRVINKHTQAERTLRYRERWSWNATDKRWWLVGGLPDFWQGQ